MDNLVLYSFNTVNRSPENTTTNNVSTHLYFSPVRDSKLQDDPREDDEFMIMKQNVSQRKGLFEQQLSSTAKIRNK